MAINPALGRAVCPCCDRGNEVRRDKRGTLYMFCPDNRKKAGCNSSFKFGDCAGVMDIPACFKPSTLRDVEPTNDNKPTMHEGKDSAEHVQERSEPANDNGDDSGSFLGIKLQW